MDKALLLGNEAIARGAWEAGVRVVSSYPGTPSTEITEAASTYPEIYSEWAVNEKVALEVCAGAACAGARAMCCIHGLTARRTRVTRTTPGLRGCDRRGRRRHRS